MSSLQAQLPQFTPSTVDEYLALQFAKRLDDESKLPRYMQYVGHHSAQHLVRLFNRATGEADPASSFHSSLTQSEP
jgi:hypothetical protein